MRLIVMYDLPVISEKDKKIYSKFRRFLLNDGYIMIQYSIYSRICKNHDDILKHINRIRQNTPDKGNVRLLKVTENQYNDMLLLSGSKIDDELMTNDSLIIFE